MIADTGGTVHNAAVNGASRPGNRLRLLYVTARYPPFVGGTEVHTAEIAQEMAGRGHDVTVLTTDVSAQGSWEKLIHDVRVVGVAARPRGCDYYFAPDIFRYITRHSFDLIHCQGYHTFVAPLAMSAAIVQKTPFVVSFHSGGHSSYVRQAVRPVQQLALRPLLTKAERLIGVSQFEIDYFRKRLRLPAERFVTVPNGSDLPEIRLDDAPAPRDGRRIVICSVGRLERYKGHHLLIESLPHLRRRLPNVHVQIVGSGPYGRSLERLARRLAVDDAVEFLTIPFAERDRMTSLLREAHLVVLLSRYESQGLTAHEALALGCPVVVADRAALGELAALGAAWAVPPGSDSAELARILAKAVGAGPRPQPAGVSLLRWSQVADRMLDVYTEVLAGARA